MDIEERIEKLEDRRTAAQRKADRARRRAEKLARKLIPLKAEAATIDAVAKVFGKEAAAVVVEEAHEADLELALACALVEQESGGKNIFGCDLGSRSSVPFCNQAVTEARVRELIAHVQRGGTSNGVGLTQLTSLGFILDAMESGGAWKPEAQLEVGFDLLASLIAQLGEFRGIGAYNGGPGNPIASYAESVLSKREAWRKRLGTKGSK